MYWRIEQEIAQGQKPSIVKESVVYDPLPTEEVDADPVYPSPLSTDELGGIRSLAAAATATVPGRRLLTITGAREEGDGPQPEHVSVTVSRILSDE